MLLLVISLNDFEMFGASGCGTKPQPRYLEYECTQSPIAYDAG